MSTMVKRGLGAVLALVLFSLPSSAEAFSPDTDYDCTWLGDHPVATAPTLPGVFTELSAQAATLFYNDDDGCFPRRGRTELAENYVAVDLRNFHEQERLRDRIQRQLAEWEAGLGVDMSFEARAMAQNTALLIAARALSRPGSKCRKAFRPLAVQAARVVAKLALPESSFERKDDDSSDVERWLGPRSKWTDLDPHDSPMGHERAFAYTREFRPIRAGETRAIFDRLIVVDSSWRPHVTSIVSGIEVRRSKDSAAAACVLGLGVPHLALEPVALPKGSSDPREPFLFSNRPNRAMCNICHVGGFLPDLPEGDRQTRLMQRRQRLLAELSKLIERVKKEAAQPLKP
jgi:hypothetical protein